MILRFPGRKQFHKTIFNASPDFLLCDLCGLCAMLSPLRSSSRTMPRTGSQVLRGLRRSFPPVFTKTISNAPSQFPPSVTSVRCFPPLRSSSRTMPRTGVRYGGKAFLPPVFTKTISDAPSQFPPSVTSVRCFALFASFSHGSRRRPPNSFPRTFFLTEAWEKVPQSLVHSQSTILGGHKASLLSHRGLNVLKRIGGTGQEAGIIKR